MLTPAQQNLANNLKKYDIVVDTVTQGSVFYKMQSIYQGEFSTLVHWEDTKGRITKTHFNRRSNTVNIAWLIEEIRHHFPQQIIKITVTKSGKIVKVYY